MKVVLTPHSLLRNISELLNSFGPWALKLEWNSFNFNTLDKICKFVSYYRNETAVFQKSIHLWCAYVVFKICFNKGTVACPQDRVVAVQMQIHHYTKGLHRESSCSEVGGKERRNSEGKLGRIRRKGDSEDLVGRMRMMMRMTMRIMMIYNWELINQLKVMERQLESWLAR